MIGSKYNEFDLTHKIKQILKTYLEKFYCTEIGQKKRIRKLLIHFDTVGSINVTKNRSKRITSKRLTIDYHFPIELGQLLYTHSIPSEYGGEVIYCNIMKNEAIMR